MTRVGGKNNWRRGNGSDRRCRWNGPRSGGAQAACSTGTGPRGFFFLHARTDQKHKLTADTSCHATPRQSTRRLFSSSHHSPPPIKQESSEARHTYRRWTDGAVQQRYGLEHWKWSSNSAERQAIYEGWYMNKTHARAHTHGLNNSSGTSDGLQQIWTAFMTPLAKNNEHPVISSTWTVVGWYQPFIKQAGSPRTREKAHLHNSAILFVRNARKVVKRYPVLLGSGHAELGRLPTYIHMCTHSNDVSSKQRGKHRPSQACRACAWWQPRSETSAAWSSWDSAEFKDPLPDALSVLRGRRRPIYRCLLMEAGVETTPDCSSLLTIQATLLASCSNLWVMTCWVLPAYTPSKDCRAEDSMPFWVTFGLKPSSSFVASVGKGWRSELLNDAHSDLSQSSRNDDFCSDQVAMRS